MTMKREEREARACCSRLQLWRMSAHYSYASLQCTDSQIEDMLPEKQGKVVEKF